MLPNQKYLIVVKWKKKVKYANKLKDIDDYVKGLTWRLSMIDNWFPIL